DDVLAVLWIPRLNLELPVYLGASRENLAKGAALLGQTSMPLGGENTNTVIAAHRGYYGAEMLRNVQQIQVGDKIQLTTPWETLIYRVSELKIIDPSDINAVLIQPGRDLLTLSTCHPYTRNSQRYLVLRSTTPLRTPPKRRFAESAATWDAARQVTVEAGGSSAVPPSCPCRGRAARNPGARLNG
ncbi:MAG: class C sortase, partial [Subdoligranulum sp.]